MIVLLSVLFGLLVAIFICFGIAAMYVSLAEKEEEVR